jgi:vacuolar iron transporter family protein
MAQRQDKARYRAHRQREFDSAALDQILGDIDKQPQLAEVYRRLAIVEEQHAAFWGTNCERSVPVCRCPG